MHGGNVRILQSASRKGVWNNRTTKDVGKSSWVTGEMSAGNNFSTSDRQTGRQATRVPGEIGRGPVHGIILIELIILCLNLF
jgi:hypothetical protein